MRSTAMYFEYDSEVDAGYVRFRPKSPGQVAYTESLDENRNVDYDADEQAGRGGGSST